MGDQTRSEVEDLERVFTDTTAESIKISYATIRYITKDFAQEIGRGAFGVVFLGGLRNGMVAVKRLKVNYSEANKEGKKDHRHPDDEFLDEVKCLKKVNHRNIVRFLGYCVDTQGEIQEIKGKLTIVEVPQRLLCFEYVPNGSLHRYLKEKTYGYEWNVRYQIIKGICEGLHHIHQGQIHHFDLKPDNVLLGANMEPKITDFGVSRCINAEQGTMFTNNIIGTLGYIAPELFDYQKISSKSDIFSLGVIMINVLTGHDEYFVTNWHETIDTDCSQMKRCIEIAQSCVDRDPHKRPTTSEIISSLNETETFIEKYSSIINEPINDPESSLHQIVQSFRALPEVSLQKHSSVVTMELDVPECLLGGSKEPSQLPYQLLRFITADFSEDRKIGEGGFAVVYKGILRERRVAVKRLHRTASDDDEMFRNQVNALMLAHPHKNIVQILGYCYNIEHQLVEYHGDCVMAQIEEKVICLEYLTNGILDRYISDASCGLEWGVRHQIIKGICDGLHHLHGKRILHMDLNPSNILLDDDMVPKISDFYLSRRFGENQSSDIAKTVVGTSGYMAPEYFDSRVISFKSDIYSLGITITEMLTGRKRYIDIENVLESWCNRLGTSRTDPQLKQVRVCAEIANACIDHNPEKRPDIQSIVEMLAETETRVI